MPDALEQIKVVLKAPIPFFFALLVVAGAIWGAFEWGYRAVLEKRKTLYELSRLEVQHAVQAAGQRQAGLEDTIQKLTQENEDLKKQRDQLPPEVRLKIDALDTTLLTANSQLVELGKANTAVSEALGRQGRLIWGSEGRLLIDEKGILVVPPK